MPSGELRLPVTFHRAQNLNFWMQVYNLGIDEKSKQNGATIEYQILDLATNKTILETQELTTKTESEFGPGDDGEELAAGELAAGQVSGQHQGERWSHEAADRRICAVYRGLGRCGSSMAAWLCGFGSAITGSAHSVKTLPIFWVRYIWNSHRRAGRLYCATIPGEDRVCLADAADRGCAALLRLRVRRCPGWFAMRRVWRNWARWFR